MRDLHEGVSDWRLWSLLGWQDIKQRYRRSTLGPLWLTVSMAIQMLVMGFLGAFLFHNEYQTYLPFLCSGLIFWTLITSLINDGAIIFVSSTTHLTQIRHALTTFLLQVVWRNTIICAHNFVIYIAIAAIFLVRPSPSILLWPLGVALVVGSVAWMALVAGIISARFRDVPLMIQSLFNVLFWVTPLVYYPEQLGAKRYLIEFNPFTHLIALVRAPLLGDTPTLTNWFVSLGVLIVGWAVTILFFARFRARIVYWL